MKVRLEVVSGPETGRSFEFDAADSFLVGRSPKAHLVLDPHADRQISRNHFMIHVRPPRCLINDLDSTNGTFVNGARIRQAELADGDTIQAGQTTIRVGMVHVESVGPEQVLCAVCCRDVSAEVADTSADEREPIVYTCRACAQAEREQARRAQAAQERAASELRRRLVCMVCARDVSSHANADGRAAELADALYVCPTCSVRLRAEGFGKTTIGDYRLLSELGRGGMGVVFKAVHQPTFRLCAVKQILPEAARDERAVRLFDREVGVQSMVIHPNLVRVLERGSHGRTFYCALELMPGGDAAGLLNAFNGPVPPPVAGKVILDVLRGLEALHARGFVHRDLKPPNFLLSRRYDQPGMVAKVTDYGLAKSFEEAGNSLFDYTRPGEAGGSLMFMPPEQLLNYRHVKPPTDVYAVGVSLYYLLTGRYTVDFPTPAEILLQAMAGRQRSPVDYILEDPPVPILRRHPGLPRRLAQVVDKAVCKDLAGRHSSAKELRVDVERALA